MAARSHAGKGAQRLSLAAGGDEDHLFRRVLVQLFHADEGALRDVHIPQLLRHGRVVDHAAAAECHLAAIFHGQVDDLLDAVDVGCEGRNDDALVPGAGKQAAHTGGDLLFGGRKARTLGIGGVAQQGQNALLAVFGQGGQVGDAAGQRGVVDLEVTGLDDGACRAVDGKGHRIRDGVVHMDGFHRKAAQLELLLGGDLHELGLACQAELFQLVPDEAAGQASTIDGQIELLQQIGDAADVVFVAVGDEQALDLLLILHHEGEIRDDQIHAVHVAVREDETAVHDDHIAAALIDRHILAHFAQAAQRVDVDGHSGLLGLLRAAGPPLIIGAAGAGPLFAGGFRVSVLSLCHGLALFLCLCHSYLQKINHKTQARPFCGRPVLTKKRASSAASIKPSYRIYRFSAVSRAQIRVCAAHCSLSVHLFDATAAQPCSP